MLTAFAGQAALALERSQAQREREMYVILEDRERIARDLHDVVIQRLFATGMHLQTAARLAARPEVGERINAAVDDLDTTIREIRSAIFELRTPMSATLRSEVRRSSTPPPTGWACARRWSCRARSTARPRRRSGPTCWPCCGSRCPMWSDMRGRRVRCGCASPAAGSRHGHRQRRRHPRGRRPQRAGEPARPRPAPRRLVRDSPQHAKWNTRRVVGADLSPSLRRRSQWCSPSSLVASTAACVRRSSPSLASRLDT